MQESTKKKVFVALSGGVDSSVAAALLQKEGYDVTGVFIKVWQPPFLECTWPEDRLDAMRVCALLEIPFKTYDFEEEYKRDVVDYMVSEYKNGRTPNPDVMCNTKIKFDAFFHAAMRDGADYIATGHYVRKRVHNGVPSLYTALDTEKDQTYFLWGLTKEALSLTLFPIGNYQKAAVRSLATQFGLPTATKKDSQGLCFLGKLDMKNFLEHFVKEQPGAVLDEAGEIVGKHDGALFYTVGQRHGFHIHRALEKKPHYVIGKNMMKNTITVSADPARAAKRPNESIGVRSAHWLGETPEVGASLLARSRYRQPLTACRIEGVSPERTIVSFPHEVPVTPPGQSLVFYEDTTRGLRLVGGGVVA